MNMREAPKKLADALLLPINPSAVIILGLYTMVWGLWLICPFWDVFSHAALYSQLASLAPETFWGSVALVCGFFTTLGAIKRRYKPLIFGAATAAWHWFMITVFYFMGDWQNTGGITALTFCTYAIFVYLNIRTNFKDERESDHLLNP